MKKVLLSGLFLALMSTCCFAQKKMPDAASLLPLARINSLLSCQLTKQKALPPGGYCTSQSADGQTKVVVEYISFGTAAAAEDMLKMNADDHQKTIKAGNKAVGVYTAFKAFPDGGAHAYFLAGPGDNYTGLYVTRLQFVIADYLITVDTQGIPDDQVEAKTAELYKTIKANSGY